jgi:hypothetical protein
MALTACGDNAGLLIDLQSLSAEDPYVGVETMLVVARGRAGEEVGRRADVSDLEFQLPELEWSEHVTVEVVGLDGANQVVSRGAARPTAPSPGEDCCVTMCFCLSATFEDSACTCGSNRCRSSCAEP